MEEDRIDKLRQIIAAWMSDVGLEAEAKLDKMPLDNIPDRITAFWNDAEAQTLEGEALRMFHLVHTIGVQLISPDVGGDRERIFDIMHRSFVAWAQLNVLDMDEPDLSLVFGPLDEDIEEAFDEELSKLKKGTLH